MPARAPAVAVALAVLVVAIAPAQSLDSADTTRHAARPRSPHLYSSYVCQGGSTRTPVTPFRGTMNSAGEFSEMPLTVQKRSCDLRNVCWKQGRLTYFMDPTEAELVDKVDRIDGFDGDDFVVLSKRNVNLNVDVVNGSVPRHYHWLNAEVAVYLAHSWSENFGHALMDDAVGAFKLMHTHDALTPDAQIVYHDHCNSLYGDQVHTGGVVDPSAYARCAKFDRDLMSGVSRVPPLYVYTNSTPPLDGVCARRVIVGASPMGLRFEHMATGGIYRAFRDHFMRLKGIDAAPTPYTTRRQHVTLFVKSGGVSNVDVDPDGLRALAREIEQRTQVAVTVMDPAHHPIQDQVAQLTQTTLFITPMGGIDASSAFVHPHAAIMLVGMRDGVMMCGHCYTHTGPLVLFDNATTPAQLTFDRLKSHIYKALLLSEHRFGLDKSFARQ